jgi:hypothetical protein
VSRPGFLLAEDEAIKLKFSGIKVYDDRNANRDVQVFFRYPESETERSYPFITLELIDIIHAKNRQHSENFLTYTVSGSAGLSAKHPARLDYWPDRAPNLNFITNKDSYKYLHANEFVPIDLLYQISTYTRSALHDRQLTSHIMTKIIPFRKGIIEVGADNTFRHLDLLDWATADLLDPEAGYRKRIFRKVYTIQMTAELPSSGIAGTQQVTSVVPTYNIIQTNVY